MHSDVPLEDKAVSPARKFNASLYDMTGIFEVCHTNLKVMLQNVK